MWFNGCVQSNNQQKNQMTTTTNKHIVILTNADIKDDGLGPRRYCTGCDCILTSYEEAACRSCESRETPPRIQVNTNNQTNKHTIFFNVAGLTNIQLSPEDHNNVYSYIEDVMNGDGLYEGASKETILEAYYDQELSDTYGLNWIDHISTILEEIGLIGKYKKI